jgi:hypothetical protein
MNEQFRQHVARMAPYMERLLACPPLTQEDLSAVPRHGIYVFYEDEVPIYVGRSNNMRSRLRMHCRSSSGHLSATFAFLLARRHADCPSLDGKTRQQAQDDPDFRRLWDQCKSDIRAMQIRVVEIDDQIDQTLFEVYAALELQTKYNDWHTH